MKIIKKVLKWIGLSIGSLLLLIILTGLCFRLFSPKPQPPGELVDIGGFKLHINSMGEKNNKPTLVIEGGAGAPSEYYYWLGEGLKDNMRVVRYDRAGIGYSELSNTPRDPETIARELHTLLEESGEKPPYIMAGHSYGGHYIRVFTQLYPDEVAAMFFLDSPHPDIGKRLNMPPSPSYVNTIFKSGAILGDLGIIDLFVKTVGPILRAPGLPEEVTDRYQDYSLNGKYLWGYLEEEKGHSALVEMARKASDFGSLPIRVFSGTHLNKKALQEMGLDPEKIRSEREKMQQEIADISTNGKLFFLDGGHITIFTKKENADVICQEVIQLLGELED